MGVPLIVTIDHRPVHTVTTLLIIAAFSIATIAFRYHVVTTGLGVFSVHLSVNRFQASRSSSKNPPPRKAILNRFLSKLVPLDSHYAQINAIIQIKIYGIFNLYIDVY